jgi:hypothetical protein
MNVLRTVALSIASCAALPACVAMAALAFDHCFQ